MALSQKLGPLETRIVELLWASGKPLAARELVVTLKGLAYTTIMTTLERLHRKGLVVRHRRGRAFAYQPRWSRSELVKRDFSSRVTELLAAKEGTSALLLAFVQSVGEHDIALLDTLDELVKSERRRLNGGHDQ